MSNLDDYLGMLNELRVPTARVARYNSFGPVSEPDVERYSRLFTLAQQFLATSPSRKNLDTFKTAFSETAATFRETVVPEATCCARAATTGRVCGAAPHGDAGHNLRRCQRHLELSPWRQVLLAVSEGRVRPMTASHAGPDCLWCACGKASALFQKYFFQTQS